MIRRIIEIDEDKCNGCGFVLMHATKMQSEWLMEKRSY